MLLSKEKTEENLLYSLANGDGQKIYFLKKMQVWDFYKLLECRDAEVKEQNKQIEAQNKKLKRR